MHLFRHIPQCSIKNRMRTFLIWMEHCGMWNRCIMGFSKLVYRQQIRVHSCVYWGTNWHWNWVFRCYSNLYKHMQSSAVITRSNIVTYNMIYYRNWGRLSIDTGSTKNTPYLALMGELWGVFCECLCENWQRYSDTACYMCLPTGRYIILVQLYKATTKFGGLSKTGGLTWQGE